MKITWLSNSPHANTGYANQTRLFLPRLQSLGHELAVVAFYGVEGGVIRLGDIPIYPRGYHPYGQDVMAAHTAHFNNGPGGVLISLMDSWVIQPDLMLQGTKWLPWYPIDHDPLPPLVRDKVSKAYARIVYSHFGERMMDQVGLDTFYVPHGVDCDVFKPKPQRVAREAAGFPQDLFVIGMVAANKGVPSRKAFQQQLEAFALFHAKHPDTMLYLHTVRGNQGHNEEMNLPELVDYLGLSKAVAFADNYAYLLGYPDEQMNNLYNAFDVLSSVSMGEGFGIPILEAQAAGTPVIVGDWTSMSELNFSGWAVDRRDAVPFWTPLASYQFTPRAEAIAECYEEAYRHSGDHKRGQTARKRALEYDADTVTQEYWRPTLAAIERRVNEEQERQAA